MAYILLAALLILELGFTAFELTRPTSKRRWTPRRFVADSAELVLFLLMVFLPGIDLGFRFKALFTILVIRLAVAGLFAVLYRKNDKTKKRSAIVMSAVISVILLAVNMMKTRNRRI